MERKNDVEAGEQAQPQQQAKKSSNRKTMLIVGAVALAVIVLFAILIPTVFINKDDDDGKSEASLLRGNDLNNNSNNTNKDQPEEATTNNGDSTDATTGGETTNTDSTSESGSNGSSGTDSAASSSSMSSSSMASSNFRYVQFDGPFEGTLPLFDSSIAKGYSGDEDAFKTDLTNVAKYYLNDMVRKNTGDYWNDQNTILARPTVMAMSVDEMAFDADVASVSSAAGSAESATFVGEDVDNFETNNQEENVVEADVIKSDGSVVYAAYGDYIVMWDARAGTSLGEVRLPSLEEEGPKISESLSFDNSTTNRPWWYYSKPTVRSMLLNDDRLVVIAEGYGELFRESTDRNVVLSNYRATRVYVYDVSGVSNGDGMTVIDSKDINGYFSEARAIGTNVHVVTMSGLNYYPFFDSEVNRWNLPENITDDEYTERVLEVSQDAIPQFVGALTEDLMVEGQLPDIARMSVMQTEWNASQANSLIYDGGLNNFYVQVSSFDVASPTLTVSDSGELKFNSSGTFMPFYGAQVYAAVDTLVIAARGYDYIPGSWSYNEFTYLVALDLEGASATTRAVGQVPGTLINNYAVDVMDGVLRIGTTVTRSGWCCGPWMPMPIDFIATEPMVSFAVDPIDDFDVVDDTDAVDSDVETDNGGGFGVVSETTDEIPTNSLEPDMVGTINSIPINTLPPDDENRESRTTNYMTMLQIPPKQDDPEAEAAVMTQLGQLTLGKKDESFTTIRFFDNVAYAVTFERTDPFYALDLSDPTDPKVLGELEITGFSDYLHSMNDDNTLLLAVGQEADEDGMILGLQVTVFDARDPTQPTVATRYTVEQDEDAFSSSQVSWDFKAIRYDRGTERLILPVDIYNWENPSQEFHGFYVFVVNENEIVPSCRIQHGSYENNVNSCYYCAYFPARSMIFGGDVTTVDSHFVRSTDLNTCESVWELDISLPEDEGGCCGWY